MITVVHCTKLELTVIQVAVTQREKKTTAEYLWIHLQCTYNMKEEILTE